ncbi:MAG: tRNA pseudouridine(55) synthase TruB [Clostridia bacterium]|nr:tRNA pseudouridine(55) synthase TruB [Clostridia bacterium]
MNGVISLLKPPGMSSQAAVSRIRRLCGGVRAGHAGTLDPEAAGVLPVMLGRATKLSDYLMHGSKEYIAELRVGLQTDTLDSEGAVVAESPVRFSADKLRAVLPQFTGSIRQQVPAYSAVKVHGQPLYAAARCGRIQPRPSRTVHIDSLELLGGRDDRFLLRIVCRQGTYVRSLLSDLAAALGTVGYTSFLLRARVGRFVLPDSCTLEEIEAGGPERFLTAAQDALEIERLSLPAHLYPILDSGAAVDMARVRGVRAAAGRDYAVLCRDVFFGVGRLEERGLVLKARVKLPDDAAAE